MDVLRTPNARFDALDGYPFPPHWIDVGEVEVGDGSEGRAPLRVHVVDEGARDGEVVLMLHGEPSWSYLYRKVIPVVVKAGLRAVAPDLVGFGKSDKPAHRNDYTYKRHVAWMRAVIEKMDLKNITLLCQDWGGLIGLRLVGEIPDRFARVVAANTFLPTGEPKLGDAFFAWQRFSQEVPEFPAGKIVSTGCSRPLSENARRAYDAPFPDETYKAGARQFPMLVPASPEDSAVADNLRAWEVLSRWEKPFLTIFGDSDPITAGADRALQRKIPGCAGQPHATLARAGHFIQEDAGEELAELVVKFVRSSAPKS